MADVFMPKLSDSMQEGTILQWLADDGAQVEAGAELAEIETDKATMTYEAEDAGMLRVAVAAGDTVPVGAVIAQLLPPGGEPPAMSAAVDAKDGGTAVAARPRASPVARRIAERLAVDLRALTGTGPQGRIVKQDVEAAAASASLARPAPVEQADPEPEPATTPQANGRGAVTVYELTRAQRTVARRMSEAKATMPEFTLTADVDMDAAVELRGRLKALDADVTPSYNDLVVRAAALALRAHPRVNGAYRDGRFELFDRVNVGVAVAAQDALLVPTVRDADRRTLGEITRDTRRLAAAGRAGTLSPADLASGTFTVSNLGMFGVTAFTAVLNAPQAAILAVGALRREPVVRGDDLAIGHRMTLTLTCDHRILYGADAAAFFADLRAGLEQPLRLML